MAKETVRFTINLNKELADSVDIYANKMNINRTAAVAVLLSQAISAQQTLDNLNKFLETNGDVKKAPVDAGASLS